MADTKLSLPAPAGVVAQASADIAGLDETLWAARSTVELVGTVEELQVLRSRLTALEAGALAELDARQTARKDLGWGSTADWFAHLAGLTRGAGRRAVVQAHQLVDERPETLAALRAGDVSTEQARVLLQAVDELPSRDGLREEAERLLLHEASRLNATDLARAARHLLDVVDPEKTERDAEKQLDREERAAHLGRYLSITEDGAGGVRLKGRGTVEDAAAIRAALLPLTAPVPDVDPQTCEDRPDPRDHGARMWDALVEVAQHALITDLPPQSHGAPARVSVTIDLTAIRGELSALGVTEDGMEMSASAVRQMACDADLIPVALGGRSEVLDVGRLHRLVTPALWRALVCRDQHCAFPGCTRPPVMCHAHHIWHWVDGGPTSLDNMVLFCGHHHRLIHSSPWEVRIDRDDGRPEFRPPPKRGRPAADWIRWRPRRE